MSDKPTKASAEKPRGFRDRLGAELLAERRMLETIREVYESYGFDPLETPVIEFADALGKFLPDQDRPNEGVFAFRDDDEEWLSLRYDLTAPLARFVAENYDALPKPFRRYQVGQVFRNEKPGPGRYREFTQFDADTVGTASMLADGELCMMVCDTLERLGLGQDSVVKVNNRKVLNGVLEAVGIVGNDAAMERQRLGVLRAIDKLDRLGVDAVGGLLGAGRKDESGDFTKGAGLGANAIERVLAFTQAGGGDRKTFCAELERIVGDSVDGRAGVEELRQIDAALTGAGYGDARVRFDPSVVRGLAYYTGPVIEAELTFEVRGDDGNLVRFGSVAGGGRYDDLVTRFKGMQVPATGISIGVSRLQAALNARGLSGAVASGPVVVLAMDKDATASYVAMARELRAAGIRAEVYTGTSGMKAQLKYADKRVSPVAVIEGSDERAKGVVTLKDLILGAEQAKDIKDRAQWASGSTAQVTVPRGELVAAVKQIMANQAKS
jgi:histidyl-tRNA synthetase